MRSGHIIAMVASVWMITNSAVPASASKPSRQVNVPLLEANMQPSVMNVPQPCPLTKTATLQFRNNHLTQAKTVDWNSAFGVHDLNCVADYNPKVGSVVVPAQGVVNITITLSFTGNCTGKTDVNFQGTIQGSIPADQATTTLRVNCNQNDAVPSMGTFGLAALFLLLVVTAFWAFRRRTGGRAGLA